MTADDLEPEASDTARTDTERSPVESGPNHGSRLTVDTDAAEESAGDATNQSNGRHGPVFEAGAVDGTVTTTGRWSGVQALGLGAVVVGILVGAPTALLAGLAGVGFGAYATAFDPPVPSVTVERTVSERRPDPGERVRVTLRVRNEGDQLLPDLRFADGVPPGLVVVDGTARHTTALRPGKHATIEYEVRAVRGHHDFSDLTVVSRDVSGARQLAATVSTETTTVECRPTYEETTPSLDALAARLVGRCDADATGEGVAFHSLREYRSGDPPSRIDWNRYARTGDLSTRRFERPRRRTVVLAVDARAKAYVTVRPESTAPVPAVDECVHAAGGLASRLLDADARLALGALGPGGCWLEPGSGRSHRRRVHEALTAHEAFDWEPPDSDIDGFDRLLDHIPPRAVVVLVSPMTDDAVCRYARELLVRGHDAVVVSPDVVGTETTGGRVAALERETRLAALREAGVSVLDSLPAGQQGVSQ